MKYVNEHNVLLILAALAAAFSFYAFFGLSKLSSSDHIALVAVLISVFVAVFTILSRFSPASIVVNFANISFLILPDSNKQTVFS